MKPLMLCRIVLGLLAIMLPPFSHSQPMMPNAAATSPAAVADPPLDIVLVLDNSGSMKQNDPQRLTREVVTRFLEGLGANTRMGMVVFDEDARLIEPLTALDGLNAKINFLKGLDSLNYRGRYTNSPAAIERALYELRSHGREQAGKIVIFLTDGIVDTGDSARDREKEQWLKDSLTAESRKLGVRLFTIAFTDRADYQLIQTLAMKTSGEYFRAYQAGEIEGVFQTIHQRLVPLRPAPVEVPTPVQPPVVSAAAPAAPSLPPAAPTPPPSDSGLSLLVVLAVALVGIVAVALTVRRGSRGRAQDGGPAPVAGAASEPPLPQAELLDLKGIVFREPVRLAQRRVRIGRTADNDIVIPGEGVSALHATIHYQDGAFYLEDQRSSNGTWLNDDRKRLEPHHPIRLKSGDRIRFDACELKFLAAQQPSAGGTILAQDRPQGPSGTVLTQPEADAPAASPGPVEAPPHIPSRKPDQTVAPETRLKTPMCPHHASLKAEELCTGCQRAFCTLCVDEIEGKTLCKACQAKAGPPSAGAGA